MHIISFHATALLKSRFHFVFQNDLLPHFDLNAAIGRLSPPNEIFSSETLLTKKKFSAAYPLIIAHDFKYAVRGLYVACILSSKTEHSTGSLIQFLKLLLFVPHLSRKCNMNHPKLQSSKPKWLSLSKTDETT
jgi:hypothetical protein